MQRMGRIVSIGRIGCVSLRVQLLHSSHHSHLELVAQRGFTTRQARSTLGIRGDDVGNFAAQWNKS